MHLDLCFCEDLKPKHTDTKIVILMHWGEKRCITNTAHLLPKCLTNSEVRYRGNPDRSQVPLHDLALKPNTFVLFPTPSASILNAEFKSKLSSPATLIALDGNWGQASQMMRKEPVLQKLPKVMLPSGPASEYHLRRNQITGNVCTFEAVARALGQLEGAQCQTALECIFNKMVSRSLWTRGKIKKEERI